MAKFDEEYKEAKYVNFFQGLIITERHLNDLQHYHAEKRWLQNRFFHGYGTVPGIMNELRVSARKGGDALSLEVGSGLCLDPMGRELVFPENKIITVEIKKYKPPRLVYVVLSYLENMEDHFVNEANPTYQGYQTVRETSKLEIIGQEPDPNKHIELARISLEEAGGKEGLIIKDAKDFGNPKGNEIDLRFVPWCRPVAPALSPELVSQLSFVLERTRDGAALVEGEMPLQSLRELQLVATTSLIVLSHVDFSNLLHLIKPMIRLDQKIIQEVMELEKTAAKKHYTTMEPFQEYKTLVSELAAAMDRYNHSLEELYNLFNGHLRAIELLKRMLTQKQLTWEDVKLMSDELPKILLVGETKYTLVDSLNFASKENLEQHMFETKNSKDVLFAQQTFNYPDGKTVSDVVLGYAGGTWTWKVRQCLPNKPLIMIRRFDYFHGDLEFEIQVGGKPAGNLMIHGRDTRNRWRNWSFQIDASRVTSDVLDISQKWVRGQHDAVARVWFYQPTA